jgi:flavin-binding protein dodecin
VAGYYFRFLLTSLGKYINKKLLTIIQNFRSDGDMTDGDVYKIIELVGTSKTSWEEAVKTVVDRATKSLRDLRIAEVKELDVRLENGKIAEYRAKVRLSFKYEGEN